MALALYRKYRPATFAEVVGQEHVTGPLRTALAAGRINHAYLFSGPRGCGKTSSARILARSLNCVQGPTPDPCGVCPSCVALAPEGSGSIDVVELDAASHGGVNDTRELRDRAFYMPAEARYRIFIIDEAHMVSKEGFNSLLKIVEEPPEHLVFIFATTEPDKVLTTIRSRTHHYPFRLIPPATLRALLERLCAEEQVTVEPAVFPLVIQAGGGSARDSLSVLDQLLAGAGPEGVTYQSAVSLLGVTDAALLDETVDALAAGDGASVFGAVDKVVEAGHDPRRFAADLLQRLRDLVIIAAVPDAAAKGLIDAPVDELTSMAGQAERLGAATTSRMAEVLHTGLVEMRGTTSPRLVLELMCARMLLPAASLTDSALLQRLERMERRMSIAGEDPGVVAPDGSADRAAAGRPPATRGQAVADGSPRSDRSPRSDQPPPSRPAEPVAGQARTNESGRPVPTDTARAPEQSDSAPEQSDPARPPERAQRSRAQAPTGPDLGLPEPPQLSSRGRGPADAPTRPAEVPRPADRSGSRAPAAPAARPSDFPGARRADSDAGAPAGRASSAGRPDAPTHRNDPESAAAQQAAGSAPARRSPGADAGPSVPTRSAPTPTPVDSVGVTDVRKVWAEVLAAVKRIRRTTQVLLEPATVAAVDGRALVLTMSSQGLARKVMEPGNADVLRAALREVLGVDWTIRCDAADGGAAGVPARPTGPRGPTAGRSGQSAAEPLPPEPPPDDEDIPDDYGAPPDPDAPPVVVRDPEEVAIELLTAQLGAKRLEI